ncbi:MAG TPA: lysophospholipid acyltransferase family protein [Chthoniobacterales bacterium]|jgi:1-acyl-sn-glycerol-3-phosphate acyltransferase|nr:lysophospholipid acyltransferase family protein [Chthoniobacterales bacterium]
MTPLYRIGYTLCNLVGKVAFDFKVYGRENLIEDGAAILASNHQSYLDPPCIGMACRNDIYYLARNTLYQRPLIGPLLKRLNTVPVDRDRGDVSSIKTIIRLLRSGHRVIIFPEGTRSLDGQLQPARAGLGMIIAKTLAPVVPVRVFGSFEALPRVGGLKLRPVSVVVGKPMRFSEDALKGDRDVYQKLSNQVMEKIAGLELPAERRG